MSNINFVVFALVLTSFSFQAEAKGINNQKKNKVEKYSTNSPVVLSKITVVAENETGSRTSGYNTVNSSSSTRTNTSLLNTPQAISVVNQNQILDQNIVNMEEAIRYVPGINIRQGEGHRDQVTIRGNATTADFFVDGARDDLEYIRDFYNTDRIEILKGPNAMAFGRGGSGGAVNRVLKYADGKKIKSLTLSGGSFDNRRAALDLGGRVNEKLSLRLNSMYEKSNSFRQFVGFEKYAFNPTATINAGDNTEIKVGYEHFRDSRTTDRGIPSDGSGVYKASARTFFGNPNENNAQTKIDSVYAILTHDFDGSLQFKNNIRYSKSQKFYQNTFADSAVNSSGLYTLKAYNDMYDRNTFTNQSDLIKKFNFGATKHTALIGSEITNQDTQNLRKTGFFNGSTSTLVSASSPLSYAPIQYSTASNVNNNSSRVEVYGLYLQDQIEINKYLQLTGGFRLDHFKIGLTNNHTGQSFYRTDNLLSPRLGIVAKPKENLSIYTNYNVTYLPSAGDQFNNMTAAIQALKPEKMENFEVGTKWDISPKVNLSAAIYQLNRTNTRNIDPIDSTRFVLTGESRTRGVELSATGKITKDWEMIAGYAHQDAVITGTSFNGSAGKKVPLVPKDKTSVWNKYNFTEKFALGLGIIDQSAQYAAFDNSVKLKGFTRFDAAAYYKINNSYRLQFNAENIANKGYIQTAHNNNNILPGTPRMFKFALLADF